MSLAPCLWSLDALGEALSALSGRAGLGLPTVPNPPPGLPEAGLEAWFEAAAGRVGLEVEPLVSDYGQLRDTLERVAPALLVLPGEGTQRLLLLASSDSRRATLLDPQGRPRRVPLEELRAALAAPWEGRFTPEIEALLDGVVPPGARRERARRRLLAERLAGARCGGFWMLRLPPSASLLSQLREARLLGRGALVVATHIAAFACFVLAWGLVGAAALDGRLERGWLVAWGLLLLTTVPLQQLTTWSQGVLALEAGALLKRRLLLGALRMDPDERRSEGVGLTMGRVNEAEAMEQLALSGGVAAGLALLELAGAAWVLSFGGAVLTLLLAAWVALLGVASVRHLRRHEAWARARLEMTGALVERMAGHRTRLAQEHPERWHEGEDQELSAYMLASAALDASAAHLRVSLPRGWMFVGLAGLGLLLVGGATTSTVAVGLGGVLLAARALGSLSTGLTQVAGAAVAARQVWPLYAAADRPGAHGEPGAQLMEDDSADVVMVRKLDFAYPGGAPVLRDCSLRVARGDRILLTGSSGGGKSTLAAVLLGLREPTSGLVLAGGLDRATLGEGAWRRRVCSAPQFHDNHVLANTFMFNLLMGRRWPPEQADVALALEVCDELGLGELIERMPGGLLQLVGETGWRLSHGEKSRLYIARTLLQDASLIVLDESFAALDPQNLKRAMATVQRRAQALVVIAHP